MTPGDDAPATRADFLRDLAGHGFAPPEGWPLLANDRLGSALPVTPDASAALDASLAVAVDGFAAEFWELPPSERRERWAGLSARGGDRATTSFLAHLKRGLNEVARPDPDPVADELAGIARELFVLRPRPRAVRRMARSAETVQHGATARTLATPTAVGCHAAACAEPARRRAVSQPAAARPVSAATAAVGRAAWEVAKVALGFVMLVILGIIVFIAIWIGTADRQLFGQPAPQGGPDFLTDANNGPPHASDAAVMR
jgi:hypothetical protein